MSVVSIPIGTGLDQSDNKYCGNPRFTKFEGFRVKSQNEAMISPGFNSTGPYETRLTGYNIENYECNFLSVAGNQCLYTNKNDRYAGYLCNPVSYGYSAIPYTTPISSFDNMERLVMDFAKHGAYVTSAKDNDGFSIAVLGAQANYSYGATLILYRFDNNGNFKRKQQMSDQSWITSASADANTDAIIFAGLDVDKPYFGNIYWSESQQKYFETFRNTLTAATANYDNTNKTCILTAEILNNSLFVCLSQPLQTGY